MKSSNRAGYSGQSWKELEKIINSGGASRGTVFEDWLDLMLCSYLSLTDNIGRGNMDPMKWDGEHEAAYMKIVERYPSNQEIGRRPMDHFQMATGALMLEIAETGDDCLGEIFMCEITFGEHGQFFTPESVTDMMAQVLAGDGSDDEPKSIYDPACGSGRTLLSAHKRHPGAFLVGVDLDSRCAKMFALNLIFQGLTGDAYCGDSLAAKMRTVWRVRGGWVTMEDIPEPSEPMKAYAEQATLF